MNVFVLLLGSLFLFMLLGMPVVFSLFLSSILYLVFYSNVPFLVIAHRSISSLQSFPLLTLPLYILAADMMNSGRISNELFKFARSLVGHRRGSLGYVNVLVSMLFAGMSGSMSADIAGLGKIEIPMMEEVGFDKEFSVGLTGASSIIGPIIPPSIQMIIYGMIAEQSIGQLFVGGFIPGLVLGGALLVTVYVFSAIRKYPYDAQRASLKQILYHFRRAIWALVTPAIILSGIVFGIFTPTEAAVVAVVWAFFVSIVIYKTIKLKDMMRMLIGAVMTSAMILFIMGAAAVFGWIITIENAPNILRDLLLSTTDNPGIILLLLIIAYLILGCFFDISAVVLVFTPMLVPILRAYGIDLIHWGVVQTLTLCIGFVTPPFGVGLFILSDMTGMSVMKTAKTIVPFIVPMLLVVFLITYIPEIVLFLPRVVFFR
jgi:tripartite ATP-independent transporter DctM subunit